MAVFPRTPRNITKLSFFKANLYSTITKSITNFLVTVETKRLGNFHSFQLYLLSISYVLGTVLIAGDTVVEQVTMVKISHLCMMYN